MGPWTLFLASALVLYAYLGYPLFCWLRAWLRPRPLAPRPIRPQVTVVVAAWREAARIGAKVEGLARQSYPAERTELVVVCDGSDDGTAVRAQEAGARWFPGRCRVIELPQRRGKPAALNAALAVAAGEILVLTDARQGLDEAAIERLVEDLGDPTVGAVGGQVVLDGDAPVGAYWRYESLLRRLEGESGSTVGVSGALYAVRRELMAPLPEETILDDLLLPMRVRLAGRRVAFEPAARCYDTALPSAQEWPRKVRTLSGNFQLLLLEPALLAPWRNPSWFDFVSHKLLRLVVPYALVATLVASATLPWPWGGLLVGPQLLAYGAALLRRWGRLGGSRLAGLCEAVVVLNAAAVVGGVRFARRGRRLPWA